MGAAAPGAHAAAWAKCFAEHAAAEDGDHDATQGTTTELQVELVVGWWMELWMRLVIDDGWVVANG